MATICITGANRGIGLELARQYRDRGDAVIAACRLASAELDDLGVEVVGEIDVTDDSAVRRLVDAVGDREIDVLINNAGVLSDESLDDLDFDRIRNQLEVNSMGPLRVTAALRPRLDRGAKVAIITSRMGSIDDNTSGGRYGYRMSKAAVNMAGRSLAHDLKTDGVAVAILHPGFVRTDMTGHTGMIDPPESAAGLMTRIDELTLDTSGSFWHANGEPLPW
ncbi:MAG: SDR family oxidoreductase [Thermoanaerobaculales bacterium]|jgi:NAD(P)-dependent dehydrogenase (short-subunit alcohol dehydrogenase family)|nr:SDR family oxidoreductase [Thermoanaerobaculales bacterium]